MPNYFFEKQFADKVIAGEKGQTIRQSDKKAKPGDVAVFFSGSDRIGEAIITEVIPIKMGFLFSPELVYVTLELPNGNQEGLLPEQIAEFAALDGFDSVKTMMQWFEKNYGPLPFEGFLHKWDVSTFKSDRKAKHLEIV